MDIEHKNNSAFTMADRLSRIAERHLHFGLLAHGRDCTLRSKLAFTMAEILISLTIIGVIAAITLPSLRANINEKTWATQRKALYSRISQAMSLMGNINSYGVGATQTETNDKAALAFVTDGLNKVLKINNICDSEHLKDCGIPTTYRKFAGSKASFPKTLYEFNSYLSYGNNPLKQVNTKVAAFETANGESVAVFYNPQCVSKDIKYLVINSYNYEEITIWPYFCANFVYDLNGKKGPNKVGKDIWYMSVLYSDMLETIQYSPESIGPYQSGQYFTQAQVISYCASINARLATLQEMMVSKYNATSFSGDALGISRDIYDNKFYITGGSVILGNYTSYVSGFRCIYRDKK